MAYRRILARPHVLALCAASVLARLPVGMGSVALVIFVHDRTGSFGAAGLAAGAFTIGLGATSPLLGRLVDRRGPRPVLIPAALLTALALAPVVVLAEAGAGTARWSPPRAGRCLDAAGRRSAAAALAAPGRRGGRSSTAT